MTEDSENVCACVCFGPGNMDDGWFVMNFVFILNSILLGVGLAMDAFSVSCANGLREPRMKSSRMAMMAGVYAGFQFLMPILGWFCVRTAEEYFSVLQNYIPWIAMALLFWIGGKMLIEGIREDRACSGLQEGSACPVSAARLPLTAILVQGVATSIDALSVGFTIAGYDWIMALSACLIIAAVTFVICMGGLLIGRKVGERLAGKAGILGGVILIFIGIEIVVTHYFLP